jgi:hypothetical protein
VSAERPDPHLTGRIGGLVAWSRNDAETMVGPAHVGFRRRFERLVDPDGTLPEAERTVRADRARRAYMLTLAAKSAVARRKRPGPDRDPGRARADGSANDRPPI